jgi:3-oxoacyl-[acyl-carrier protein] reductase
MGGSSAIQEATRWRIVDTGIRDKVALVTGSSRGIGRSIALALAREGVSLVINGLDDGQELEKTAEEIRGYGVSVLPVDGDVTDDSFVASLFRKANHEFDQIDILVNNAGGGVNTPFESIDPNTWDQTLNKNLRSAFICASHALPSMRKRGFGRVINTSSQLAVKGGYQLVHYAAAKAGLIGMTKSLGLEYAGTGVTVNAIAPGRISTEERPGAARVSEEWLARKLQEIPMGRFGHVDEVAPTAVLVASTPGGDFYTGQVFHPNGGEVMP